MISCPHCGQGVASDAFTFSRSIFFRAGIRGFYSEAGFTSARVTKSLRTHNTVFVEVHRLPRETDSAIKPERSVSGFLHHRFTGFDVLPAKFESPPYTAVTDVVPTLSVEVVKVGEGSFAAVEN